MMTLKLFLSFSLITTLIVFSVIPDSFAEKKYDALVYSPIRPNNSILDEVPNYDEIKNDMQILKKYTDTVVLFDSRYAVDNVLSIAQDLNMKVIVIVDLKKDEISNNKMITIALIQNRNYDSLDTIIIGSNEIADGTMDVPRLVDHIEYAKFLIDGKDIKVSSINNPGIWIYDLTRELAKSVDVIYFDNFQYGENKPIQSAVSETLEQIEIMNDNFSDVPTIGMVGWPTNGSVYASVTNQIEYTNSLLRTPANLVWFESFDESWKGTDSMPEEASYGFIDSDRQLKIVEVVPQNDPENSGEIEVLSTQSIVEMTALTGAAAAQYLILRVPTFKEDWSVGA